MANPSVSPFSRILYTIPSDTISPQLLYFSLTLLILDPPFFLVFLILTLSLDFLSSFSPYPLRLRLTDSTLPRLHVLTHHGYSYAPPDLSRISPPRTYVSTNHHGFLMNNNLPSGLKYSSVSRTPSRRNVELRSLSGVIRRMHPWYIICTFPGQQLGAAVARGAHTSYVTPRSPWIETRSC